MSILQTHDQAVSHILLYYLLLLLLQYNNTNKKTTTQIVEQRRGSIRQDEIKKEVLAITNSSKY